MFNFTCPICGVTKSVTRRADVRIYCGKSCASTAREMAKHIERDEEQRTGHREGECIYQPESIICFERECDKCGWNPTVAKERLERIGVNAEDVAPENVDRFGEWISTETKLPRNGVQVLTYTHTGKVMALHCKNGSWCAPLNVVVTHWMPMPNSPKE